MNDLRDVRLDVTSFDYQPYSSQCREDLKTLNETESNMVMEVSQIGYSLRWMTRSVCVFTILGIACAGYYGALAFLSFRK